MYQVLNPSQKDDLDNELTSREENVVLKAELAYMENQVLQLTEEIKNSENNVRFWKSTAIVLGVVASFMFVRK